MYFYTVVFLGLDWLFGQNFAMLVGIIALPYSKAVIS